MLRLRSVTKKDRDTERQKMKVGRDIRVEREHGLKLS